jgi:hypothetical protein
VLWLAILYSLDMYFQSFGAVSIVKVNAAWFHVRERGVQGGVFGILISLGIYFGYDWSRAIAKGMDRAVDGGVLHSRAWCCSARRCSRASWSPSDASQGLRRRRHAERHRPGLQ